ncbi:hypothetical protein [Candidatus Magnetominusculus xianensis]|uniref:CBM-cenC domain-containing protein n=1 Tax=Candidatus Magnetominusculus xianensis TaxID=1748249 RepID=A0ABR5SHX8_9BACT|nr:hypothetical protein [Candidatus Magnetominusculus xianensis]KWT91827.1 hypothetical protein ASN18_0729 [Candidatus Magnetominusculus xianensis]
MALRLSTGLRNKILGINTNLLTNGDFGIDFSGWTQLTGTTQRVASTGAVSGTGYAECVNAGSASAKFTNSPAVTVKSNRLYKLTYYYQKPTSSGVAGMVSVGSTSGGTEVISVVHNDTAGSWVKKEYTFRTGASQTALYLSFQTNTAVASDKCWFDQISLTDAAASLQEIFYKGFIQIFSGSQPASPDSVPSGTLLCTIYSDGTSAGLSFDDAASGTIAKAAAETWSGTAAATATAGWFRLTAPGDSGALSTTEERIDGSVATSGSQLNMSSTSITSGAVQTISTFTITMPSE